MIINFKDSDIVDAITIEQEIFEFFTCFFDLTHYQLSLSSLKLELVYSLFFYYLFSVLYLFCKF